MGVRGRGVGNNDGNWWPEAAARLLERDAERAPRGRARAGGLTNRELAQALFITVKTVENHLRNAYAKLGVAGKRDLAAVLARPAGAEAGAKT